MSFEIIPPIHAFLKQDWMKIYHLYRLRRLRDAADAELQPHHVK